MRYHLFTGMGYYPQSGLDDYVGGFDLLEDAEASGRSKCVNRPPYHPDGYFFGDDWWVVIIEDEGVLVEVSGGNEYNNL